MSPDASEQTDLGALSPLAREVAVTLARVGSDIALVVDADGVIRTVAEGTAPLPAGCGAWVGQRWVDTVTAGTRRKIELLLEEANAAGITQRREVSHPADGGDDLPLAWTAIRLGQQGPVVAVGRDLRAVAAIQRRFLDAQHEMEQAYWHRRATDSRYRLLFHVARDAVLAIDAQSFQVIEANEAACQLLGQDEAALIGRPLTEHVPTVARAAVAELLAAARISGRPGELRVRLTRDLSMVGLSATPFRAGDRQQLLVRARAADDHDDGTLSAMMRKLVDSMADGVVITDSAGRIVLANPAFISLVTGGNESNLQGRPLSELVGEHAQAWDAVISRTRESGLSPRSTLRVGSGVHEAPVEVCVTLLTEGEQEHLGFTLRAVDAHGLARGAVVEAWPGLSAVRAQIGYMPLPALLREAAHAVERQLILTALRQSADHVPAAARLLAVEPSTLLGRLRALGIGVPGLANAEPDGLPASES